MFVSIMLNFRGRPAAASLKHLSLDLVRCHDRNFRGRPAAASLKRYMAGLATGLAGYFRGRPAAASLKRRDGEHQLELWAQISAAVRPRPH